MDADSREYTPANHWTEQFGEACRPFVGAPGAFDFDRRREAMDRLRMVAVALEGNVRSQPTEVKRLIDGGERAGCVLWQGRTG